MANHNTNKNYYEIRALLTLQTLFPEKYQSLIHSDKPDLIDASNNMGVEVCRVVNDEFEKRFSYFSDSIKNKSIFDINEKGLNSFTANGNELILYDNIGLKPSDYVAGFYTNSTWHSNDLAIQCFIKKLETIKKNSNYGCNVLNLYVFSDSFTQYDLNDIKKIIAAIKNSAIYSSVKIDTIYFDDCGWFYECKLATDEIEFFNTEKFLHNICVNSEKIAEGEQEWQN